MNTLRKVFAIMTVAAGLAGASSAFAGYYYNACWPGYCPVYVPTCNYYGYCI